ncbi:hypothetical protein HYV85_05775 [Candidatus Woesearchaeota archaeon]|nr:hypothetical protein [Candidatus Woesearchaeota archaeon]
MGYAGYGVDLTILEKANAILEEGFNSFGERDYLAAKGAAGDAKLIYNLMQNQFEFNLRLLPLTFHNNKGVRADLEALLHNSERGIARSRRLEATVDYETGTVDYNAQTRLLEADAKTALESAVKNCAEAYKAFTEYRSAFVTWHEGANRAEQLKALFAMWTNAYLMLGMDAQQRANKSIAAIPQAPDKINKRTYHEAVKLLMAANDTYSEIHRLYKDAKAEGIQLHRGTRAKTRQGVRDILKALKAIEEIIKVPRPPEQTTS